MVRKLWCTILLGLAIASQPLFAQDTTLVPLGFAIDEPFVFARLSPQYIYISGSMELLNGVNACIVRVHRRTGEMEVIAYEVNSGRASIYPRYPDLMMVIGSDTLVVGGMYSVIDAGGRKINVGGNFIFWSDGRWWEWRRGISYGTIMGIAYDKDTLYFAGIFEGVSGGDLPPIYARLVKVHVPTGEWFIWGQTGWWGRRDTYQGEVITRIVVDGRRWIAMMGRGLDTVDGVAVPSNIALYDQLTGQWEAVPPGLLEGVPWQGVFVDGEFERELWIGYWLVRARNGGVIGVYNPVRRRWVRTERLPGVRDGDIVTVQLQRAGRGVVYALYEVWRDGEYQGRYCARWEGGGWQEIPLAAEMVPEDAVVNIVADEQGLYAAGSFSLGGLNGAPPQGIVCVAQYDAEQRQWRGVGVHAQGARRESLFRPLVNDVAQYGEDTLIVGGRFQFAGGKPAANIAFLRTSTMEWFPVGQEGLPRWYPGVTGEVYALAVVGEELYVGGKFTRAGEQPIRNLACFDLRTGRWRTVGERSPDGPVTVLRRWGDSLWVGGGFYMVDTLFSPYLAIWDLRQQRWVRPEGIEMVLQPRTWDPPVRDIEMHDGKVYVLGFWYFKAFAEGNRGDTLRGFLRWDGRRWDFAVDPSRYRGGAVSLANWHIAELQPSHLGLLVTVGQGTYLVDGRIEASGLYVLEADSLRLLMPVVFAKFTVDTSTGEIFGVTGRGNIARIDLQRDSVVWFGQIQLPPRDWGSTAFTGGDVRTVLVEQDRVWVGGEMTHAGHRYSQGLAYWKRQPVGVELERSLVRTGRSYPVPAHEAVWVEYELELGGEAVLEVVDGLGRVVSYRVLGWRGAGRHRERVELAGMAAGVYRWCIRAGQEQRVGWMVLVR
jgi:hypothetical protein